MKQRPADRCRHPEDASAEAVGSIIIAGEQKSTISTVLGVVAVAASVTNIVSGFLITDRMLKMFRERTPRGESR